MTAMFYRLPGLICLFVCLARTPCAAETVLIEKEWRIENTPRRALLHVPPAATREPAPVVFFFHGHGGTMQHAARTYGFHQQWPEAIVVYMQGLPTPGAITDPQGKRNGWQRTTGDQNDRDLKFFDEVLATLRKDYKVDEKRVYSTGHSNGGAFTYLLWVARCDVFAAFAPSASATRQFLRLKPKPALHLAGETDELVSFAMQKRMIEAVRKLNGCSAEGKPWDKSGPITGTLYPSPTGTPLVTLIYPGTHKYPLEATALIIKFFKEQVKK